MTYFFTCFFLILYLVRPTDLIPSFRQYPLFQFVSLLAVATLFVKNPRPRPLKNGTDQMMLGFLLAMGISQVANGWAGGALQVTLDSSPFLIGYAILAHGVDTERRWKGLFWLLIACCVFIVFECHQQILYGSSLLGVEPLVPKETAALEGGTTVVRVRWSGPFHDPNDLAMLLVFPMPFLANNVLERRWWPSLLFLGILGYGVFLTHSRGGMLSAIAGVITLVALRKGTLKALIIPGIFALLLLALMSGRFGDISAEGESARGRVESWREAMALFRSAPLFGIGKGNFLDYHELTAHNSFYLVLAELGALGAFFFLAVYMIPLRNLYRMAYRDRPPDPPTQMYACGAGMIAVLVSMLFLSRAYFLMAYVPVALWVAQGNFHRGTPAQRFFEDERLSTYGKSAFKLLIVSIVLGYVVARVLN